ncbi:hypothetical protein K8942_02225 [Candidatus Peribacteria bacterium]|nr:MAG: hypothetical protein K8942_02225 [Candidatus Peribacteria bacterium]
MNKEERIAGFVEEIWAWYMRHKRILPWRDLAIADDTQRAYMVLVSEIMLQQTQVPRVMIIFKRFLDEFPTVAALAQASNKEVILAWKGMGYNSRALRLRDAANIIIDEHQGIFPKEMDQLLSIKGIGPYTAAAIRNFAFNIPTPCIDTNIRRILHRTFVGPESDEGTWDMNDRALLKIAAEVLDHAVQTVPAGLKGAADWHAALMDFGSLVQTKSNPKWDICPLTEKNLMKATPKNFPESRKLKAKSSSKEPGRMMGATYIPNRIFRGRIVDALREHHQGLDFDLIGQEICTDWTDEHHLWLEQLLLKLKADGLIAVRKDRYVLGD